MLEPHSLATMHYFDRHFDAPAVKLLPTEYYVGGGGLALTTVLGSCVAACLHDPGAGIGGMNHFMLPGCGEGPDPVDALDTRYGAPAMELLMAQLLKAGARRERLSAKVFGGGMVIPGMVQLNIGQRNADFVLQYLQAEGVPVVAQDLGGTLGRHVCYFPGTGRVAVRLLRRDEDLVQVQQDEQQVVGLFTLAARRPQDALR